MNPHSKGETLPKDYADKDWYITAHAKLQKEIQEPQVLIDYSCFKKTAEERDKLKAAKANYKLIKNLESAMN